MMKDTSYRAKKKVSVTLQMTNDTSLGGFVFCNQGERVSDLLNDSRKFLPFETKLSEVMMLAKDTIACVTTHDSKTTKKTGSDPYEILDLAPTSNRSLIKKAYHNKVRAYHPDQLGSADLSGEMADYANEMLTRINGAYDALIQSLDRAEAARPPNQFRSKDRT